MRRKIVAGNWKMNSTTDQTRQLISQLLELLNGERRATVVVCPPFTSLQTASELLEGSNVELGAQNVSEHESGAYTGDVAAGMLLTVGCVWVILGHSERRQYHAETDELVNAKARLAFSSGLKPIICVGESLEERESGRTEEVVCAQVDGVTAGLTAEEMAKAVIAYEPVWAIGTGRNATPEMAQEVHCFIRNRLKKNGADETELSILYGGSVKPDNAAGLMAEEDIDGALVGGASLKADDFVAIVNSV